MEMYKVGAVVPGMRYLYIVSSDSMPLQVQIPNAYIDALRPGMRLYVHKNRAGNVIAYTFDKYIVFASHPINRDEIRGFLNQLRDVYSLSLDSLCFKYNLRRALRKHGMIPTRNTMTNMIVYNLCMGLPVPSR